MRLGNVVKHRKGSVHISDDIEYMLCRVQLHNRGVILRGKQRGYEIKTKKQQLCRGGDFIVAEMDAKLGGYGFIPDELDGAIVSSHYYLFELDLNKIRPTYLEAICKLGILQSQIHAVGSTNYSAIRPKDVLDWEIPDISIERQLEIEKLYLSVSQKSESMNRLLKKQNDLVNMLRQAILREAMQGKLVPQDPNDEPASELLKRIKAEKAQLIKEKKFKPGKELPPIKPEEIPYPIPDSWVWCRLGVLGICQTGSTPPTANKDYYGSDIPFIKPADITLHGLKYDNEGLTLMGLEKSVHVRPYSILMVCIGGSIGKSFYNSFDVSCNQQINTITFYGNINHRFMQIWLQSKCFQKAVWMKASGGTTPIINRTKWESILIPLPPLAEQCRLLERFDSNFEVLNQILDRINNAIRINGSLYKHILLESLAYDCILKGAK